jgi:chromosome condensin MukBEF ATPase and DNA-binding subunit MukB
VAKSIESRLSECREIIDQLKGDNSFMRQYGLADTLKQYEESLNSLQFKTDLSLGYLTSIADTLKLWKRE